MAVAALALWRSQQSKALGAGVEVGKIGGRLVWGDNREREWELPYPQKYLDRAELTFASACCLSVCALPAWVFHADSFLVLGGFQPHLLSWSPVHPSFLPVICQCHSE